MSVADGEGGAPGWFSTANAAPVSFASGYEQSMVPIVMAPCAEALADALGVQTGDRVLDVACGTGAFSRVALQRSAPSGQLVGVDVMPAMLEVAAGLGLARAQWRQGNAEQLPVEDHDFDLAACQQGLQFFADKAGALREMVRALKPGGRLGLAYWCPPEANPFGRVIIDAYRRVGWEAPAAAQAQGFSMGDAQEMRSLLAGAGLREITLTEHAFDAHWPALGQFLAVCGQLPPAASYFEAASEAERAEFRRSLDEGFAPYELNGAHSIPMTTLLAVATR